MQRQNHRICTLGIALALALYAGPVIAQETIPELTGTVAFNVESASGRVERLAVTIGDGGTGRYKAILMGEPSLPTHAIYRPRDLRPFGGRNLLPIVAFGNGGCRNTSGEFRNFLSELASQGFLVVAIGPAGNAVVMGSEERTNTTAASQLLDAVTWATAENARAGSAYFQKLDVTKVAVSGQSCGASQAIEVSSDPRVTTTIALNQGINIGTGGRGQNPAAPAAPSAPATEANRGGAGRGGPTPVRDARYAPHAPALVPAPSDAVVPGPDRSKSCRDAPETARPDSLPQRRTKGFRSPYRESEFRSDTERAGGSRSRDVGHYPATYRQPNGGDFAKVAGSWLKWQLKGDADRGEDVCRIVMRSVHRSKVDDRAENAAELIHLKLSLQSPSNTIWICVNSCSFVCYRLPHWPKQEVRCLHEF